MSHALGEMYYLATQMEQRRKHIEKQQHVQQQGRLETGLVFICPRVSKEYDTIVPLDTDKSVNMPVDTVAHHATHASEDWCVIM